MDDPSDPNPLHRSRVLNWTSEDLRRHSEALRDDARRLKARSRDLRTRIHTFLHPPPTGPA